VKLRVRRKRASGATPAGPRRGSPWIAAGTLAACTVMGSRVDAAPAPRPPDARAGEPSAAPGQQPVRRFDIVAGPLSAALAAFQSATGVRVVMAGGDAAGIDSPGVQGDLTVEQALRKLLEGTGLSHRWAGPDSVALELRTRESVTVTATGPATSSPKYTEPLREIPQTIAVIPDEVMQAQGASTLRDVLRNVTGISIQAGEGGVPAGDNLSVRGFNARTDIFIDGVRDSGGYSRDPFNLEQVEVAKGPASTISGRGSTGGSVNLVSKAPGLAAQRSAQVAAGGAAYKRGTLDLNQPLDKTGLPGAALRFNAMWTDADVPGRDAVTQGRWGVAPSLALGLGTATRVTLSYFRLDQDNLPEYGLPWVPNTNVALEAYRDQAPPVDFRNFYGLRTRDYEKTGTDVASAVLDRDLGPSLRLRNLVRYGHTRRDSVITAPRFASNTGTAINRQLQSRDQEDSIWANQTDLTARVRTGALEHALVAGLELDREKSVNHLRSGPAAPTADLFNPDPDAPYPGPITRTGARNDGRADTVALYAFDTVSVGARWELSGGVRWDRFDVDYESRAATGELTTFERTDELLSGRGAVVFKPRAHGSVYAGYGVSFNPSAEGLSLTAATALVAPERSRSVEMGTKWDLLAGRLAVSAAAFRTDKTNARTPGVNAGDPPTVLEGEQRVEGLELGLTGRLAQRWDVLGSYTRMRSRIPRSNTAAELGHALGNTPDHSFRLWTSYRVPRGFEVGGGAEYVGDRFNGNSGARVAAGYWLFDALAAYEVNEHLTLRLNGYNLADERYIDRLAGGHFIPGAGRSAQLYANVRF
jgi:catecholate siderophore receptor